MSQIDCSKNNIKKIFYTLVILIYFRYYYFVSKTNSNISITISNFTDTSKH